LKSVDSKKLGKALKFQSTGADHRSNWKTTGDSISIRSRGTHHEVHDTQLVERESTQSCSLEQTESL